MGKLADFFHYETAQIVRIRNVRVSVIHMMAQLLILAYIIVYGLIYKKAYQATGSVTGSADIKVKGVGFTDFNQSLPWYGPKANASFHVYDSYDLVMPAMEENALFVTSNMWVTKNQTRDVCTSYLTDNSCKSDNDCSALKYVQNGRQTGTPGSCRINYTDPQQLWPVPKGGYCDVYSWCPTELDMTDSPLNTFQIKGVPDFTVFVRMNVHWSTFGITLDNTRGAATTTNGVNLWRLEDMVNLAGHQWSKIQKLGMTVGMNAVWDCDFDKPEEDCNAHNTFVRLDDPRSRLSSGFNFRSVEYLHDKYGARQLTKHYGVRLLVLISGVGRKFDIVALLTAIGAGIGLLSVATLVSDFIATNVLANRDVYKQAKFKEVEVSDEEEAAAIAAAKEESEGVTVNDDLNAPLYGSAASNSERPRMGQLHISPKGRTFSVDDDEEAPWAVAHYPKR